MNGLKQFQVHPNLVFQICLLLEFCHVVPMRYILLYMLIVIVYNLLVKLIS